MFLFLLKKGVNNSQIKGYRKVQKCHPSTVSLPKSETFMRSNIPISLISNMASDNIESKTNHEEEEE